MREHQSERMNELYRLHWDMNGDHLTPEERAELTFLSLLERLMDPSIYWKD